MSRVLMEKLSCQPKIDKQNRQSSIVPAPPCLPAVRYVSSVFMAAHCCYYGGICHRARSDSGIIAKERKRDIFSRFDIRDPDTQQIRPLLFPT